MQPVGVAVEEEIVAPVAAMAIGGDPTREVTTLGGRGQKEDVSFRRQRFLVDQETAFSAVCEVFNVDRVALYRRTRNSLLRSMAAKCLC